MSSLTQIMGSSRHRGLARLAAMWLCAATVISMPTQAEKIAVHLPSHSAESAGRLATGLDQLTAHLSRSLDGRSLDIEIFRQQEAMSAFLQQSSDVVLVVSDASFLDGAPIELLPVGRFVIDGETTYHRVVVVPFSSPAKRLADLSGEELTVVRTRTSFDDLGLSVFAGELNPETYFSGLRQADDDSGAVTDVLFGQASAALVAEHGQLLGESLGSKIRTIYRSHPLSLPTISMRAGAFSDSQRRAITAALEQLSSGSDSILLSLLGIDGFEILSGTEALEPSRRTSSGSRKMSLSTRVSLKGTNLESSASEPLDPKHLPLPYVVILPESEPVAKDLLGETDS